MTEMCYMLKYVEPHGDPEPSINPFSIRQAIIYQRFETERLKSKHIFVRLSAAMQDALREMLQGNAGPEEKHRFISRWENIHILFLRTLNSGWRRYINYLDEQVSNIVSTLPIRRAVVSYVTNPRHDLVRPSHPTASQP